jgi:ribosome-associated protein
MREFSLEGHPYIALHNLLKVKGLCENGGSAKHMISLGRVLVNGQVELRKSCKIVAGQIVEFKGYTIKVTE